MGGILRANLAILESKVPGVSFFFGGRHLHQHDSIPPRIVWVPASEPFSVASKSVMPPDKSIATRHGSVSAHIWGVSYDQTEAMLHNLISMTHKHFQGVAEWGAADWGQVVNEQDAYLGWLVMLPISFKIPVLDKLMDLPTTPDEESAPATGDTEVTIVGGTPGASEANIGIAQDFVEVIPTVTIDAPAAGFTATEGDVLALHGTCDVHAIITGYIRVNAGSWAMIESVSVAPGEYLIRHTLTASDVGAVDTKVIAANATQTAESDTVSGTVAGL